MDVAERLRSAAERVLPGTPVLFAYLFGSQARSEARDDSDVDIAVWLDPDTRPDDTLELRLRLARRLADASGVPRLEAVVVLNDAPLALTGRVQQDGIVLWSRDEPERVRWSSLTARRFHDWQLHAGPLTRQRLATIARQGHADG